MSQLMQVEQDSNNFHIFSPQDGEQTAEVSLPLNETEDRGVAGAV